MSRFFQAVKAGIQGAREALGPGRYTAAELPVKCTHCAGEIFESRSAQLNKAGTTFFGLDWTDPTATALVCVRCGLIRWFAKAPDRVYE